MKATQIVPGLMIIGSILSAVVCTFKQDWRHVVYWISSATLIASVTF
jgi:hypothetical protein